MRLPLSLFVLVLLSGCAATAFEAAQVERERDYRALVASGLTAVEAARVLRSDSLAATVPQTDIVVAYRERRRLTARVDSLRAISQLSDGNELSDRDGDIDMRQAEAERKAAWTPRAATNAAFFVAGAVAALAGLYALIALTYE
ncbi:hypothetical protein [Rubrivirga sp.]|uniref:hypothetical protein n=1 Tax=Rubrivirga sp. TaxID=1885344 RepID=UPI003C74E37F